MMMLQAKAPLINGWLVYMGATDRNLVLLQPDFDIPLKEDWVRLDSMLRNDYDYDSQYGSSYDKISTQIETVPRYMGRDNFTINYERFCVPVWMWLLPIFLLVAFLYIHYSNYIYSIFLNESLQQEFGLIDPNQVGGVGGGGVGVGGAGRAVPINMSNAADKKFMQSPREFGVGTDFYFYPSPAIPPPKYNEIAEAILIDSSDDENDDTVNAKPNDRSVKTNFDKDKSNLSVDI